MKENIKLLLLLIVLSFNLFSFTACSNVQSNSEETSEPSTTQTLEQVTPYPSKEPQNSDTEITLSIYSIDKEAIYSEKITTEKTNLLEIMSNIEDLKIKTEDSEAGKFIVSIMDISYDYGQYWHCYINGEQLLENISLYEINDNDVVELRYESN